MIDGQERKRLKCKRSRGKEGNGSTRSKAGREATYICTMQSGTGGGFKSACCQSLLPAAEGEPSWPSIHLRATADGTTLDVAASKPNAKRPREFCKNRRHGHASGWLHLAALSSSQPRHNHAAFGHAPSPLPRPS